METKIKLKNLKTASYYEFKVWFKTDNGTVVSRGDFKTRKK